MKRRKKILALLLAIGMLFTSSLVAHAETSPDIPTPVAEEISAEDIPSGDDSHVTPDMEKGIPYTQRTMYNVNDSVAIVSGNLTSTNTQDIFFLTIPEARCMLYKVKTSNPNLIAQLYLYVPSEGMLYPTSSYATSNTISAVNNIPNNTYAIRVTYQSGYTGDASFNLHLNYDINYTEGMSYSTFTSDLTRVMTDTKHGLYANRKNIVSSLGYPNNADWQKLSYVSPYMVNQYGEKLSYASLLQKDNYNNYGVTIGGHSGFVRYASEKYQFDTAVLLYLDSNTFAESREYTSSSTYRSEEFYTTNSNSFIVYDYDTNACYQLYLNEPQVPMDYRLPYATAVR